MRPIYPRAPERERFPAPISNGAGAGSHSHSGARGILFATFLFELDVTERLPPGFWANLRHCMGSKITDPFQPLIERLARQSQTPAPPRSAA